tara:strand:+ start:119 stop:418 length:300 start_codon:yes stop_codon:yes gene_type:complete
MKTIQETYDSMLKVEDLLKASITSAKEALRTAAEIDDHLLEIREDIGVPLIWSYLTDIEQVIERLEGRQEQYNGIIWDLTQDWPELLDDPDEYYADLED